MKIEFSWEVIDAQTLRAKVPGGWLVRFHGSSGDVSLTVVPDARHEWEVVVPPEVVNASRERLTRLEERTRDPYLDDGIRAELDDELANLRRFIGMHS